MENKYFLHRIKETNGTFDKGIEVKNTLEETLQSYHAYLGAYAYGHDVNTTFVSCLITDRFGAIVAPFNETWNAPVPEAQE